MNAFFIVGDPVQNGLLLAQLAVAEEPFGTVLLMFVIFAALVVLIGMMTMRRKSRPHGAQSSVADPFREGRRDDLVETSVDSRLLR